MSSDRDGIRGGWATPGDDQPDDESAIEMTGEFTIDYAPPAWYTQNSSGASGASAQASPPPTPASGTAMPPPPPAPPVGPAFPVPAPPDNSGFQPGWAPAAAVPTPALETAWRITRRISLTARGEYLRTTINGTFGSLGDFHADAQFRWVPNFSIGAGYSLMRLKLDSITQGNPGLAAIRLRGPEIFVRASF